MPHKTTHEANLVALRRIEGQVKGIQRMIDNGKYCIDIIIQIHAVIHALYRVSEKILAKHMESCVVDAFRSKPKRQRQQKINEVINVIKKLHRL
ncbi:MAG: metal-sensitive transcriptional regulator [Candidatus Omnitrophota bacterium]|nr:MAG: metal-sensitive transcriptional regulator [Candidatus Omnitrophota bacterium]